MKRSANGLVVDIGETATTKPPNLGLTFEIQAEKIDDE
jgi:hypothetical protein